MHVRACAWGRPWRCGLSAAASARRASRSPCPQEELESTRGRRGRCWSCEKVEAGPEKPSDESTGAGAHPASHSLTRSSVVLLGRAGRSRTWHEELVLVSHSTRTSVCNQALGFNPSWLHTCCGVMAFGVLQHLHVSLPWERRWLAGAKWRCLRLS